MLATSIAPVPYLGGKSRLRDRIYEFMPKGIYHLIDVFGGAGNIVLGYAGAQMRTYNDINSELVNLMRQLRENGDALIQLLELTPHSREEYEKAFEPCSSELEQARRTFVKLTQSFGRTLVKSGFSSDINNGRRGMGEATNRVYHRVERLPEVVQALREVCLENKPASYILTRYAGTRSYFYCDPPYMEEVRTGSVKYMSEFNQAFEHEQFLQQLLETESAGFMVSCYDSELYQSLLGHLNKYQWQVATNGGQSRIETIYFTNPQKVKTQISLTF